MLKINNLHIFHSYLRKIVQKNFIFISHIYNYLLFLQEIFMQ